MSNTTKNYQIAVRGEYIYLKLQGFIKDADLKEATEELVRLSEQHNIYTLLEDISAIDRTSVTIRLQTTAIGLLWKLKHFKRIAIIYKDGEIGRLVLVTLATLSFASGCRAFDNEPEAIKWLDEK